MKGLTLKSKLPSIYYIWISLATFAITSLPANAQDVFDGARKNADDVFKDSGSGVDLTIVLKLLFGALLLFLFVTAVWQAIAAHSRAVALKPKDAEAYTNRGILKDKKLNEPQEALADFNKAIAINSEDALAYYNRGFLKGEKLNDLQGAVGDIRTAARIFRAQCQTEYLLMAIAALHRLGATENP
jgi:tetratricopeptide (TPR) repeat protein